MSEESLKRGPVSGLGRLRRSRTDLFGGLLKVGRGRQLHSGRSGGRLSVGPEPIMEIPGRRYRMRERTVCALAFAAVAKLARSVRAGSFERWKPGWRLPSGAVRRMLLAGPESITEIPVYFCSGSVLRR